MPRIKLIAGDSAGQVCQCDEAKAVRLVAAGVAALTEEAITDAPAEPPRSAGHHAPHMPALHAHGAHEDNGGKKRREKQQANDAP